MGLFSCEICAKKFGYRKNLNRHRITCDSRSAKGNIKCPECEEIFTRHELLKSHAEVNHNLKLETENVYFLMYNDFELWKQKVEKENHCFYVKTCTRKNGNKRTYMHCHRSGYFKSESQGHRRMKSQGTNKINSTCTSSMILTEDGIGVSVVYCKTHFGHTSDLDVARDKYSLKEDRIKRSHEAATRLNPSRINCSKKNTWTVHSRTKLGFPYDVSKIRSICAANECTVKCRECNICIHLFKCQCSDYVTKSNICKHIHACVLLDKNNASDNCEDHFLVPTNDEELDEDFVCFEEVILCDERTEAANETLNTQQLESAAGVFLINQPDERSETMNESTKIQNCEPTPDLFPITRLGRTGSTKESAFIEKFECAANLFAANRLALTEEELSALEEKMDAILDILNQKKKEIEEIKKKELQNKRYVYILPKT